MKKISYILAAAIGVLAFSSCCADKEPIYQRPAENSMVLNVPAMQDQYIDLTEGDYLELTTSQPDYGYSAVANYGAQVSLTEDFSVYENVDVVNTNVAAMQMKQESIAVAYCALKGVEDPDQWAEMFPEGVPYETLYFRATCELSGVTGSYIASNVVTYNHIKPYFAVPTPGYIYLIGDPNGWAMPDAGPEWRLYEPKNNIGCGIYSAVFSSSDVDEEGNPRTPNGFKVGNNEFRFYTELIDWGSDGQLPSVGSGPNDFTSVTVEFEDGSYAGKAVPGKGNWLIEDWDGGDITIVVDMSDPNNMTVTITAGAQEVFIPEFLYVLGDIASAGWAEPIASNIGKYENSKIFNSKSAPNVFTGTFKVEAGTKYFRFFSDFVESDGWNNPTMIGSRPGDNDNVDVTFTEGSYTSAYVVPGKGNWTLNLDEDTEVTVAVDRDNETVVFTIPE